MTATDQTIASMGLPRHPPMSSIALLLSEAREAADKRGLAAIDLVAQLAAIGYPGSTLGDGGSRGSDSTSSTERNALRDYTDRWAGASYRYAQLTQAMQKAVAAWVQMTDEIMRHGDDVDPTPAGTGECLACGRFCRPDGDRPGNRLRSGLCPTDYRAWRRYLDSGGQLHRGGWVTERRKSFTDDEGVLHTPEPDHDIDLSRETA